MVLYFVSSPLQVVSLCLSLSLLIVSILFLFDLILNYFGSKNLSLYQNTILAMLITNQNSVHFSLFWSVSIQLGPFYLLRSIQSNLVHLVHFGIFLFIHSTLIKSILFGPIWSITPNSIQFGPFCPNQSIQSIWSIWSISDHFSPIQCTYLRKGKKKVWVESSTNYFQ